MILLVSSSPVEAAALSALGQEQGWPTITCPTVAHVKQALDRHHPRIVVSRHRLADGYSDDVIALVSASAEPGVPVKNIVLAPAVFPAKQEARQIHLGADCVLRDPIRLEVLVAHLTKFHTQTPPPSPAPAFRETGLPFAGATVFTASHRLEVNGRSLQVTPREIEFIRLLHRTNGRPVSYEQIYAELFRRTFSGDTSNSRVLFARLKSSFRKLGLDLTAAVRVRPKSGYTYDGTPAAP